MPRAVPRLRAAGLAALVVLAAAGIGAASALWPDLLHLDVRLTALTWLALLGAAAMVGLLILRPGLSLALLVVATWLDLSQVLVRYHGLPSLLQLLAAPMALAAVRTRGVQGVADILRQPLALLAAAYGLVMLLSTTYAFDEVLATGRALEQAKALAVMLLLAFLADSVSRVRLACWSAVGAGVVPALLAMGQVATGQFDVEFGGLARVKLAHIHGDVFEERIAGPIGDPNFFAQVQLMLVCIALTLAVTEGARWRRRLALVAALVLAGGCVLTYSRGGALALAAVLAAWVLGRIRSTGWKLRPRHLGFAAAAAGLLVLLVPTDFARRLTTLQQVLPGSEEVEHPDSSFEQRRLLGRVAWRMFLDDPVLGVGTGNYTVHFDKHAEEIGSSMREYEEPDEAHYPHDLYLEIGAETGMLGLVAFTLMMGAAFMALARARRAADPRIAAFAFAVQLALVGWLLSSVFLHGHFPRHPYVMLGLALGLDALARRQPLDVASR